MDISAGLWFVALAVMRFSWRVFSRLLAGAFPSPGNSFIVALLGGRSPIAASRPHFCVIGGIASLATSYEVVPGFCSPQGAPTLLEAGPALFDSSGGARSEIVA
jgi:hypothetical protein